MYDRKSELINIKTQLMQRLCNLKFLSDILTQQFTFDLRNFSNTMYVQHYKTTTQQLTTDLCYDKEGLNSKNRHQTRNKVQNHREVYFWSL